MKSGHKQDNKHNNNNINIYIYIIIYIGDLLITVLSAPHYPLNVVDD